MFVIATVRAPSSRASLTRGDRVARLARLRDGDDERVLVDDGVPVDPFARDVELDRDPRPLLDDVAARRRTRGRRCRSDEHDALQLLQLVVGHAEPLEHEPAVADAVADRLGDGLGLLVDLLEHERLVAALLGALVVPVELDGLVVDDLAVRHREGRALRRDRDDLAVARELHRARLAQEGGRVRRQEALALAEPDDERHLEPRADEQAGMVAVDDDEGEVPLELAERAADRLDEVALVVALDEMDDGLGVGLGRERVPVRGEALLELAVVLDDPVEDDRKAVGIAAGQRVRVLLGDPAVRRPARVSEACGRARMVRSGAVSQVPEVADRAHVVEPVLLEERKPGRVVAAVLQALEALEKNRFALTRADVPDDPAHVLSLLSKPRPDKA